jgi:hypothetical protein
MILGFNTDVRYGATVYHVQSEPRHSERVLQTQVFVGGRCIGKRSTSYANRMCEPGFFEEDLQEMLKQQHRAVVDAARAGCLYDLLREPETPSAEMPQPARTPVEIRSVLPKPSSALEWVNRESAYADGAVQMQVQLSSDPSAVVGVPVTCRLNRTNVEPAYAQTMTDEHGRALLRLSVSEPELGQASLLVQAKLHGATVTKKFRFKRG